MTKANDINEALTAHILGMMENADPNNWAMPWHVSQDTIYGNNLLNPKNPVSGTKFSGTNWLALVMSGFKSGRFATYRQWQQDGKQVKAKSKGVRVIKFGQYEKKGNDGTETTRGFVRQYTVFPAEMVEGCEFNDEGFTPLDETQRIEFIDKAILNCGAGLEFGNDQACCRLNKVTKQATVMMPDFERFESASKYYQTLFHEFVHATRYAVERDDVLLQYEATDKQRYAFEELVAELGAAMLAGAYGISTSPDPAHADYLASWIKLLKHDNKAFTKAASLASKACKFIMDKMGTP